MSRTILTVNASNMPVATRKASIYTGVIMAEYFRDQGCDVALMTGSTSYWVETLREVFGCLEEVPVEEDYPAYLLFRVASFYGRTGSAETLPGKDRSVTLIGTVSPAGGNFSEPVTENTKCFVNVSLTLGKNLACAGHYPVVQWMASCSQYISDLENYYKLALDGDSVGLRSECMDIPHQKAKLNEIVPLAGEKVLPDGQRLLLTIARILKVDFLQQNVFNGIDTFMPLEEQYNMLKIVDHLHEAERKALSQRVPIRQVKSEGLFRKVIDMKYDIENDDRGAFVHLNDEINNLYEDLIKDDRG